MELVFSGRNENNVKEKSTFLYVGMLILWGFFNLSSEMKAQTFQWAKSIQSEGFDEGYDLVTDPEGNTYVGGMTEFNADFGSGVMLTSAGRHDIFLAKYTPEGRLVWAKIAGGTGGDKIQSITLDGFGHIFVVGEYEDTCYWEGIRKVTPGPEVNNMFVAKYDTSGNVIWVRNIGAAGLVHTRGYGVSCDELGNVYACGGTKGDTYYESTFLFSTAGDYDGMLAKFDSSGNFQWARRMGGIDSDKAYGIVSDQNGFVYVTGYFVGNADFSSSTSLHGNGHTDIFISKYDAAGTLQWAKQAGDTGFDRGWDITQNINGEIIITGEFQTGYFGSNLAYSKGNMDMFLASYDAAGNNLWVVSGGGVENDIGRGVSHDTAGNIYVVGDYASTGIFSTDTVISNGYADVFLASYTSDGSNLNWIRSFGGLDNDRGRGVATDLAGNINVCGEYVDSAHFGSTNLIGDTLLDIFVGRIVPGIYCATQVAITSTNSCHANCDGIAIASVTGTAPFAYSWSTSPVQNAQSATGLCGGVYTVNTTDALGCSSTAFVTIIDPPLLQVSMTSSNPGCVGSCDGIAAVNVISGQGPFNISWNTFPSQTGMQANGLCQRTYIALVSDSSGCNVTASITLSDPAPLQITSLITNTSCIACADGSIILQASGGALGYQYLWSNGNNGSDQQNLTAGNYTVCVTDANNCNLCDTFTVLDPTTGISDFNSSQEYSVYPNPGIVSGTVTISNLDGVHTKYWLYSTSGQIVSRGEFEGNVYLMNLKGLDSGPYMLQLVNEKGATLKRIPLLIMQ